MKPIGPLMREHRLIERMVNILDEQSRLAAERGEMDTRLITIAVDFFRTYTGRTHHGKEEHILFRDLAQKPLSADHKRIMQELMEEHILAGEMVRTLNEANKRYSQNVPGSLNALTKIINDIVDLYHVHIQKEDKGFFFPVLEYLGKEEQDAMLKEFWEFDRQMIHEKYQKVVEEAEIVKVK